MDRTQKKRILFITGTRADYGKLKSLIRELLGDDQFEVHIFATGMHLLKRYGSTYKEIVKDGMPNLYTYVNQGPNTPMDIALSNTITGLSNYVTELMPDAIIVHGDRLEALAGAIVGAFNNIRVFHIEGGEVSGTIDESIRHAITKFSHFHFVANEETHRRIVQLGEPADRAIIFGSPDIDIMFSPSLPTITQVKKYYEIPFDTYNIILYHPVTTCVDKLSEHVTYLTDHIKNSKDNYVIIYPNNDTGSDIILEKYEELNNCPNVKIFPSMRFEYFLTLLKNTKTIIGNSSSGVREACIYGKPAIDIGIRQQGRYNPNILTNILHINEGELNDEIIKKATALASNVSLTFGDGTSAKKFHEVLSDDKTWNTDIQKKFYDI